MTGRSLPCVISTSTGLVVALLMSLGFSPTVRGELPAGALVAWGTDTSGACQVPSDNYFTAVAAGRRFSLALKSGGGLAGWGANTYLQASPPAGTDFTAVAAGSFHGMALKADKSVVVWGSDSDGQCADAPVDNDFTAIAAGYEHCLALRIGGAVVAWGNNSRYQCNVPSDNNFIAIAAGYFHSLAIRPDHSVAAWGDNRQGQCTVPVETDFIAIAAGQNHSLALRSNGSLAAWGSNGYGQCDVPSGHEFIAIAAGQNHSLALRSNGSLVAWGDNSRGQCEVPSGNHFLAIAAGESHNLAITTDLDSYFALAGTVALADYPPGPYGQTVTVELYRYGGASNAYTRTLDTNGTFSIANVAVGTYDVRVIASHWLARLVGPMTVTRAADIGVVTLVNGDCDADNAVTSTDLAAVQAAMDTVEGDETWDSAADLDADGEITSTDLSIVMAALNQRGDESIAGTILMSRDIAIVIDHSRSMNYDSQLRHETTGTNIEEVWQDLGANSYGNMTFFHNDAASMPTYSPSISTAVILCNLGLTNVPYPYPGGSWGEYVNYVKGHVSPLIPSVAPINYRNRYGLRTFIDYLLAVRTGVDDTPALANTRAQPMYALKQAVEALDNYLMHLNSDDHLSLVAYADSAWTIQQLTGDYAQITQATYRQAAGDNNGTQTNISAGIDQGVSELMSARARPNAPKVILILTDGQANLPSNATNGAQFAIDSATSAAAAGIQIHTITLGSDADQVLMGQIAKIGKGIGYHVPTLSIQQYTQDLQTIFLALVQPVR